MPHEAEVNIINVKMSPFGAKLYLQKDIYIYIYIYSNVCFNKALFFHESQEDI